MEMAEEALLMLFKMIMPKITIPKITFLFGFLLTILSLTLAPYTWAGTDFVQPGNMPSTQCEDCSGECTTARNCNPGYYCDNGNCYFHCNANSTQQYNSCCMWASQCPTKNYYCDTSDKKEIYDGEETYKAGFCKENSES